MTAEQISKVGDTLAPLPATSV